MPTELPSLDYSQQVTSHSAKQDKIEMTLGTWRLEGHTEDIQAVREYMSVPPSDWRNDPGQNWPAYSMLFNRPDESGLGSRPMEFRRGDLQLGPEGQRQTRSAPLWAGHWRFSSFQGNSGTTTHLAVSINPTTFARSQRYRAIPSQPGNFGVIPSDFVKEPRWGPLNEFPLDGRNNWIPCGTIMEATSGERWWGNLESCFRSVLRTFERELERVSVNSDRNLHLVLAPRLNLKYCETYWEFATDDPILEIDRITPHLVAFSELEASTRSFDRLNADLQRDGHSRSIRIQCGQGREVCVYAKTNRRVRFEVRHRLRAPNGFLIPAAAQGRSTGHTATNWDAFTPLIQRLALDAAQTLNSLFAFIQQRQAMHSSPVTPFRLMLRIAQLIQDEAQAAIVLNLLVMDGQLSRRILPRSFRPALDALREAGILQPLANGRGATPRPYEPTQEYRAAFEWLRQSADVVFPAVPVRTRRISLPSP